MVEFDILVSHWHMSRWHEARLEKHLADLAALRSAHVPAAVAEAVVAISKATLTGEDGHSIGKYLSGLFI